MLMPQERAREGGARARGGAAFTGDAAAGKQSPVSATPPRGYGYFYAPMPPDVLAQPRQRAASFFFFFRHYIMIAIADIHGASICRDMRGHATTRHPPESPDSHVSFVRANTSGHIARQQRETG